MNNAAPRRRFRAILTREGTIDVPADARSGLKAGTPVIVEIEPGAGAGGYDEQEVAAIAARQAEHPDTIRKCLAAQGALGPGRGRKGRGTRRRETGRR